VGKTIWFGLVMSDDEQPAQTEQRIKMTIARFMFIMQPRPGVFSFHFMDE